MRDKQSPMEKERYEISLKAAQDGSAKAMCEVARRLYDGIGVEKDRETARQWYFKSAEAGDPKGMRVTAFWYQNKMEKTPENKRLAVEWYQKAGDSDSLCDAAVMYAIGDGIPKDTGKALELLSRVESDSATRTMSRIGNSMEGTERIEWFRRAAEQGSITAMHDLGTIYANGSRDTPQDFIASREWFGKAAERGYAPSMSRLGDLFYVGDGVEQDDEQAFQWYEKAAAQGFHMAMMQMGRMYYMGRGTKQDFTKAFDCFMNVATTREDFFLVLRYNTVARQYVARMYERGEGVDRDMAEAFRWYQLAAEDHRNTEALCKVADMYYFGCGTVQNPEKALEYYKKAAENSGEQCGREALRKVECLEKLGQSRSISE